MLRCNSVNSMNINVHVRCHSHRYSHTTSYFQMHPACSSMFQAPSAVWTRTTPVLRLRMSQAQPDTPKTPQKEPESSDKATLQALNREVGPDGLVKYDLLLEDSSVLNQNIEVVKGYTELEGGFDSQKDLAFYCNAYNMWCLYLATNRMRKAKGKWKGE